MLDLEKMSIAKPTSAIFTMLAVVNPLYSRW